jgi:hypothetical protein
MSLVSPSNASLPAFGLGLSWMRYGSTVEEACDIIFGTLPAVPLGSGCG